MGPPAVKFGVHADLLHLLVFQLVISEKSLAR